MKKSFDYGIILIERLRKTDGIFLDAKSIAKEYALSQSFMEKIAQNLRRAGWLESKRGLGGGYKLTKEVTPADVISFFDTKSNFCPITRLVKT